MGAQIQLATAEHGIKSDLFCVDDTMIVNPSDPNGVDNGDDGTDIVDESGGREENGLNPAIIGGAAAGAAVLLLSAIGCFVMRGRKKPNPGLVCPCLECH